MGNCGVPTRVEEAPNPVDSGRGLSDLLPVLPFMACCWPNQAVTDGQPYPSSVLV